MSTRSTSYIPRANDIAVIGLAARVPGARNVEEFWRLLREGREAIRFFNDDELRKAGVDSALLGHPAYVKAGAVLPEADCFDAAFFGYTPREAELLDVQQRVFLECAWTAIEHAGHDPLAIEGAFGVFAGAGLNTYLLRQIARNPAVVASAGEFQVMVANDKDFLATRVSYKLNLQGPSLTVQTACSTSLVAVHLAGQSLLAGECDTALAGGVSVRVPLLEGYLWQEGMILSPDGHCRAFDARAAGTVGGNGAGAVVLKRAADAIAAGDTIHAIIRGSAINNDGAGKVGYTAPAIGGQERVIVEALAVAGVSPDEIGYVEAHGTGTPLGDPIEVAALTRAFRRGTERRQFCRMGSVKTNIGHLDAAAGVVGLIKAVLALKHAEIPPSLHFTTPNPQLDLGSTPFRVAAQREAWAAGPFPRRAGVSSFGIGGTNAHVVLEEAPPVGPTRAVARPCQLLVMSGRTECALKAVAENLAEALRKAGSDVLPDVAFTLATGRHAFPFRRAVVAGGAAEAAAALAGIGGATGFAGKPRVVAFVFPGQGTQFPGMGAGLYRSEPVFRAAIDRCAAIGRVHGGLDLPALMFDPHRAPAEIAQTDVAQPVLFSFGYGLAKLFESWGIAPGAMLGHSIGEWVAACLADVFTLEEALRLVLARGRLMAAQPRGAMLAVALPEKETRAMMVAGLDIAVLNTPGQTVIAGPIAAIADLEASLARRGVPSTRLATSHAYHSRMMEPAAQALRNEFADVPRRLPQRRWISNVTGTWITNDEAADPEYWTRHLRSTVRFADCVGTLLEVPDVIVLELGAGRTLGGLMRQHASWDAENHHHVSALPGPREKTGDQARIIGALGELWCAGAVVDWKAFHQVEPRRRVPLPAYPFARDRYWIEAQPDRRQPDAVGPAEPVARKPDIADWFYLPSWQRTLPPIGLPPARDGEWLLIRDQHGGLANQVLAQLQVNGAVVHVADTAKEAVELLCRGPRWILSLRDVASAGGGNQDGFEALSELARALGGAVLPSGARLTVVANGLHAFADEHALQPMKALLHGVARVLPREVPGMAARVVDVVWPTSDVAGLAAALIAEARFEETRDSFVVWRGGERWVQALVPTRIPANATIPLRERGTYLITGGCSGIGLVVAEDLARRAQARLVLASRSPPDPGVLPRIEAMRTAGAEIMIEQVDVTDVATLEQLRAAVSARFGAVHGIVHAAGLAGGGALLRRTCEEMAAVLAPKVTGTRALDQVFGGERLDFFVLMSSLTAQLGEFGQTDYAAANAFLDAYAVERRRAGVPMIAIGWDAWRDTGMAARFSAGGVLARWQESERSARITNEEGVEVLRRALGSAVAQVVVSTRDYGARRAALARSVDFSSTGAGLIPAVRLPSKEGLTAPRTEMEHRIAVIWSELLGISPIGVTDDFFELGGHSLLATRVVARLRDAGVAGVSLASFFESPTIAGLAQRAEQAPASEPGLRPEPRDKPLPLSFAQEALWLIDRLEGRSAHYNEFGAQRLRGPLDVDVLALALSELVRRHEVLRTRFVERDGAPVQEIMAPFAVPVPVEEAAFTALETRARQLTAEPFDLAHGPLIRAVLCRLAPQDHVLMVVVHHIVFDGWSSGVFFREMIMLYGALAHGTEPALAPLRIQYADFAVWQRRWLTAARRDQLVAFWRSQLPGPLPVLALPTEGPRPAQQTYRGHKVPISLGRELSQRLEALGRGRNASLFMTVLAGYAALLGRTAAQEEVIVGCPAAGRDRTELEPLIGYFINPLPIRVNLRGDPSFAQLLEQVRTTVVAAFAHATLPFTELVNALQPARDPSRTAVFQAMFVFQNAIPPEAVPRDVRIEPCEMADGPARTDLDLYLWESAAGISGYFIHPVELFSNATILRFEARLRTLLAAAVASPELPVTGLPLDAAPQLPRLASRAGKMPLPDAMP